MAELSEYIAPIIAPDLGSPEFSMSLVEAFNTIDSNFKKIIQAPYLKGDRGASIETVVLKKPDHVVEGNPSEYEMLLDAIILGLNSVYYPGCDPTTQGVRYDALPGADVNSADKLVQEDHFTVFKDFSTNEMYLICPYIFIDARIQYLDRITENNRQKFIDTSSIVTGKYTKNSEGVYRWTINISTNIPKLYFDDQSGYYCWLVNNEKTGIIAQGVKGKNGIDGNITICRGTRVTNTIAGANISESRIVIKGVYQQQSSNESNSQSISSTVYRWTDISETNIDLENHPVLVYGYDSESDYNNPPKYIQFGIAFVEDIVGDTTEDADDNVGDTAEDTSASNASKRYYIVYEDTLDLVKIMRENSIAKLLETISSSGSVQGLYISSEKDGDTIQNVHMFWNDSDNGAHLSKVPYSCVTQGVQDSDSIRGSKLHVNYDTIVNGDNTVNGDSTVQGNSMVQGDNTVGGDIKLQSTQGVQGTIGLQGIQHTTGDIGECELALVPSFNVSIKTEYDLSTTISGVQRLDKTILRVQTPWIGYIKSSSSTSDGIRTDNHSLYEACQLVDENGSNEYVIDITQQNNSTSLVPFWTKIPNHELGISSMFATDNEDIYIHVFQQEKTLYGSIISDYVNNTYSKYYLNFLVQVVLIKNPTNRVYATVIYKMLNTPLSLHVYNDVDYKSLYHALVGINNYIYPNEINNMYLSDIDSLYFDIIQILENQQLSLHILRVNSYRYGFRDHILNMFRWVRDSSYATPNTIVVYDPVLRIRPDISNPIYGGIADNNHKKAITVKLSSTTPILSDYVSTISMRSTQTRECSIGIIQGVYNDSGSITNTRLYVTIYPQSGIFMNDRRLCTIRDIVNSNISIYETDLFDASYQILADNSCVIEATIRNESYDVSQGYTKASDSNIGMLSSTPVKNIVSPSNTPIIIEARTLDNSELLVALYGKQTINGSLCIKDLGSVADNITSTLPIYRTIFGGCSCIQGNNLKISISNVIGNGLNNRLCILNSRFLPISSPYIEGKIRITNSSTHVTATIYRLDKVDTGIVNVKHHMNGAEQDIGSGEDYEQDSVKLFYGSGNDLNDFGSALLITLDYDEDNISNLNFSECIRINLSRELLSTTNSTTTDRNEYIEYIMDHQLYGQSYPTSQSIPRYVALSRYNGEIRVSYDNHGTINTLSFDNPWIISPNHTDSQYDATAFRMCDTRWGLDIPNSTVGNILELDIVDPIVSIT